MSKTGNIIDFIEAGLRTEVLRQKAIAGNIANLETPGYRRLDVKFEELLADALGPDGKADLSDIKARLFRPEQTPLKSNGNDVNIEAEVGEMIKNSLRYSAYIKLLNKKYGQMVQAMSVK